MYTPSARSDADCFRDHADQAPTPGTIDKDGFEHGAAGYTTELMVHWGQSKPTHINPAAAVEMAAKLAVREVGQPSHGAMKTKYHFMGPNRVSLDTRESSEKDDLARLRRRRPCAVDTLHHPLIGGRDLLRCDLEGGDIDAEILAP